MLRRVFRTLPALAALLLAGRSAGAGGAASRAATKNPPLRLTFIALDHGCATLMQPPGGSNGLIDTGGPGDGPQLVRFLKGRGISKLQVLVVSAWIEKCVGGAPALMKQLDVGRVLHSQIPFHTPDG